MNWPLFNKLLKTNTFRLTLVLIVVFGVLLILAVSYNQHSFAERIETLVDTRLRLESEVMGGLYEAGSLSLLLDAIQKREEVEGLGRFYYLVNNPESEGEKAVAPADAHVFYTMTIGELIKPVPEGVSPDLLVRVIKVRMSGSTKLYIAHDVSGEQGLTRYARWLTGGTIVVVLLMSLLGAIWVSHLTLNSIDRISRATADIIDGDLSQRLPPKEKGNEFDLLSEHINIMLTRIEDLMEGMREVTSNIAHDLRSPLTRLRNRLEVVSLNEPKPEEFRAVLADGIDDADKLINTFNALLSIARVETGVQQEGFSDVQLVEVIVELGELYEPLAEEMGVELKLDLSTASVIRGNRHLLAQALSNLLDNALKYAAAGGEICICLYPDGQGGVEVTVADRGPGVPELEHEHVFQRFVRLESERLSPGNGLGLSMVRAIIRMHHGTVHLEDNHPGLSVLVSLPILAQLPAEKSFIGRFL